MPNDMGYWQKRGDMDSIVLIDDETSAQDPIDSKKPIWLLRDILKGVSKMFNRFNSVLC